MRAGVVSDIHGSYDMLERAVAAMGAIDLILHAGDGSRDIVRWHGLQPQIELAAVAGNCDLSSPFPMEKLLSLAGWRVYLVHGHQYDVKSSLDRLVLRGRAIQADLVVFGHTHRPERIECDGLVLFNPGSLSRTRNYGGASYGLIEADENRLSSVIHYL